MRVVIEAGDLIDGFKARLLAEAYGDRAPADCASLIVPATPVLLDGPATFAAELADLEDGHGAEARLKNRASTQLKQPATWPLETAQLRPGGFTDEGLTRKLPEWCNDS